MQGAMTVSCPPYTLSHGWHKYCKDVMTHKISECKERWCCEPQDLIPDNERLEGIFESPHYRAGSYHNPYRYTVCKHCRQQFTYRHFTDAAGSSDWSYEPVQVVPNVVRDAPKAAPVVSVTVTEGKVQ